MVRRVIVAGALASAACVPFGEGVIRVRGELRSADTGELVGGCTSTLFGPSGEIWEPSTPLDAQFQRMFTVAPDSAIYTFAIACPGFRTRNVSVTRSSTNDRVVGLDLGAIPLSPTAK